MKKLKPFFIHTDGSPRWTPIWAGILVALIFSLIMLGGDIGLAFRRFGRAGLWMILGTALAVGIFYLVTKKYDKEQDFKMSWFAFPLILIFCSVLGPLVAIRADRASGIPDESGLYMNGKVINCCDPAGDNYYFDIYVSNPIDSLYIVTYGEEPGYCYHPYAEPSTAPRCQEATWRHITKRAAKLKGRY